MKKLVVLLALIIAGLLLANHLKAKKPEYFGQCTMHGCYDFCGNLIKETVPVGKYPAVVK